MTLGRNDCSGKTNRTEDECRFDSLLSSLIHPCFFENVLNQSHSHIMKINSPMRIHWSLFAVGCIVVFASCASSNKQLIAHHESTAQYLTERVESLIKENTLLDQDNATKQEEINRLRKQLAQIDQPNAGLNHSTSNSVEFNSPHDRMNATSQLSELVASGNTKVPAYIDGGIERPLNVSLDQMEEVISIAKSYLGTPHKSGGSSHSGIDCSGLIVTSFKAIGIHSLPRTALEIGRYGTVIANVNDFRRGDLVFFTNTYSTSRLITHVGIYLGNDAFIHTSSSNGVTIGNLKTNMYWKEKILFGTRLSI